MVNLNYKLAQYYASCSSFPIRRPVVITTDRNLNSGSLDLLHTALPKTTRRNESAKEKEKKGEKRGKKSKQSLLPLYKNPWDFTDSIPLLDEGLMLNRDDVMEL